MTKSFSYTNLSKLVYILLLISLASFSSCRKDKKSSGESEAAVEESPEVVDTGTLSVDDTVTNETTPAADETPASPQLVAGDRELASSIDLRAGNLAIAPAIALLATEFDSTQPETFTWDPAQEPLDSMNQILCLLSKVGYVSQESAKNYSYIAKVTLSECFGDDGAIPTLGMGMGGDKPAQKEGPIDVIVKVVKEVENKMQVNLFYVREVPDLYKPKNKFKKNSYVKVDIYEPATALNPYGLFNLYWQTFNQDSTGAEETTPSLEGFTKVTRSNSTDFNNAEINLQYRQSENSIWIDEFNTNNKWKDSFILQASAKLEIKDGIAVAGVARTKTDWVSTEVGDGGQGDYTGLDGWDNGSYSLAFNKSTKRAVSKFVPGQNVESFYSPGFDETAPRCEILGENIPNVFSYQPFSTAGADLAYQTGFSIETGKINSDGWPITGWIDNFGTYIYGGIADGDPVKLVKSGQRIPYTFKSFDGRLSDFIGKDRTITQTEDLYLSCDPASSSCPKGTATGITLTMADELDPQFKLSVSDVACGPQGNEAYYKYDALNRKLLLETCNGGAYDYAEGEVKLDFATFGPNDNFYVSADLGGAAATQAASTGHLINNSSGEDVTTTVATNLYFKCLIGNAACAKPTSNTADFPDSQYIPLFKYYVLDGTQLYLDINGDGVKDAEDLLVEIPIAGSQSKDMSAMFTEGGQNYSYKNNGGTWELFLENSYAGLNLTNPDTLPADLALKCNLNDTNSGCAKTDAADAYFAIYAYYIYNYLDDSMYQDLGKDGLISPGDPVISIPAGLVEGNQSMDFDACTDGAAGTYVTCNGDSYIYQNAAGHSSETMWNYEITTWSPAGGIVDGNGDFFIAPEAMIFEDQLWSTANDSYPGSENTSLDNFWLSSLTDENLGMGGTLNPDDKKGEPMTLEYGYLSYIPWVEHPTLIDEWGNKVYVQAVTPKKGFTLTLANDPDAAGPLTKGQQIILAPTSVELRSKLVSLPSGDPICVGLNTKATDLNETTLPLPKSLDGTEQGIKAGVKSAIGADTSAFKTAVIDGKSI